MATSTASPSTSTSLGSPAPQSGQDTAKLLVQKIVRQFYGIRGAILVDQLVRKECYRDEEIGKRLGMQPKDIAKIAHRLTEDQVVQVHRRSEARENPMLKAQTRTYYYMDYSKAVDVIKWRMWKIQQTIDVKLRNELDAQGYVCPLCKASYTPLDAAGLFDPFRNLLACSVCQTEVVNNENEEEVKGNKDRMQRLNRQTKGIVDLLKRLEGVELPRFDIESYLAIHGPALGATALAAAEAAGTGPARASVVTVHLAGDDDEALELARRDAERVRKREQNALPSWIAQSTIAAAQDGTGASAGGGSASPAPPGEAFSATAVPGLGATMRLGDAARDGAAEEDSKAGLAAADAGGNDDLDAYYASLAAVEPTPEPAFERASASATPAFETEEFDGSLRGTPALDSGLGSGFGGEGSVEADEGDARAKRGREESAGQDEGAKRARTGETGSPFAPLSSVEPTPAPDAAAGEEEEEEDDDEFDEVGEGDADPNQLISVNGKMMPFVEVTEDMTGDMTADEYSAYWDVYQRVNG